MASQQALWLYHIIHSGRLGVDRNKGHEIVMKQCDGCDDDDGEAAGKNSSPLLTRLAGPPVASVQKMFSLSFSLFLHDVSLQPVVFPLPSPLLFYCLPCSHPQNYPHLIDFPSPSVKIFFILTPLCLHNTPFSPLSGDLLSISKKLGLWAGVGAVGGQSLP